MQCYVADTVLCALHIINSFKLILKTTIGSHTVLLSPCHKAENFSTEKVTKLPMARQLMKHNIQTQCM